jgi:hypothetical protein
LKSFQNWFCVSTDQNSDLSELILRPDLMTTGAQRLLGRRNSQAADFRVKQWIYSGEGMTEPLRCLAPLPSHTTPPLFRRCTTLVKV